MAKDFTQDFDDIFKGRSNLLTKKVEVTADADCSLYCDGKWTSDLTKGKQSTIRLGVGKHQLVFKVKGGNNRTRTIEVGDASVKVSVTGLGTFPRKEPESTPEKRTPKPEPPKPENPPKWTTKTPGQKPVIPQKVDTRAQEKNRGVGWIIGGVAVFCYIIIRFVVIPSVRTSSYPTLTPAPRVESPSTPKPSASSTAPKTNNTKPSGSQNSSQFWAEKASQGKEVKKKQTIVENTKSPTPPSVTSASPYLNKNSLDLVAGESFDLVVYGWKGVITWESYSPLVASVTGSGHVIGRNSGKAKIVVTAGSHKLFCDVTVKGKPKSTSSGSVFEQKSITILRGKSVQLTFNKANGGVKWWSISPEIVSVSTSGVATALSIGNAKVWGEANNGKVQYSVTVAPSSSAQVQSTSSGSVFEQKSITIPRGKSVQLTFNKANGGVKWWSISPEIVSVSTSGVATALSIGNAKVWGEANNGKVQYSVTVAPSSSAQVQSTSKKTIAGYVHNQNGTPIVGAKVLIRGTTNSSLTDAKGVYSIKAASGDVLVFSSPGYQNVTKMVGSESRIDVVLPKGRF